MQLEAAHNKHWDTMVVGNLTKELQSIKSGPIQQCRAGIAKLKESAQESSPDFDRVRQ